MATEHAKKWNDQWWTAVVRRRKTELEPLLNVRAKRRKKPQKVKTSG